MKVFFKLLFAVYVLLATAAAGIFGYSYFTGKKFEFIDKLISEEKMNAEEQDESNTGETSEITVAQFKTMLKNFAKLSNSENEFDTFQFNSSLTTIPCSTISTYFNGNQELYESPDFESFSGQSYSTYKNITNHTFMREDTNVKDFSNFSSPNLYFMSVEECNEMFTKTFNFNNTYSSMGFTNYKVQFSVEQNKILLKMSLFNLEDPYYGNIFISLIFDEQNNCKKIVYAFDTYHLKTVANSSGDQVNYDYQEEYQFIYKMYDVDNDMSYLLNPAQSQSAQLLAQNIAAEMTNFKNNETYVSKDFVVLAAQIEQMYS